MLHVKLRMARSGFASFKINSNLYILGGYTENGNTNSVEVLNLDTMQVKEGVSLPISDSCISVCAV